MSQEQPNNPLHGVKLKDMLETLVDSLGWEDLGSRINIRCFNHEPSINSSLKFLRRTPWARAKVENLYLRTVTKNS
ncbi:MAG: VF530 family DNA-binding protein [Mariniblastus sp.]